jgi:hypothetical protein
MNRFERSWSLFKSSLLVIIRNKQLLIFPVFISVATAVIFLFFFAPAALWPTGHSIFTAEHWQTLGQKFFNRTSGAGPHQFTYSPLAIAYLVMVYFLSMFVATFFNVAFYHEILAALGGEDVSLARGLQFACSRWKAILMWALFAGLIGLIIKVIEQRFEIVGRIVARLIGVAWSIASVFVIPVIVHEDESMNPLLLLKKSAGLLKRSWGEGLIGYIGIGAINTLVFLGSMVVMGMAVFISKQLHNFWLLGIVAAAWLASMLVWSYLMNVAGLVYKGALYLYAAEGVVCEPFDQHALNSAWKYKK